MIADIEAAKQVAARALAHYSPGQDGVLTFVKYRENYVFRVDQDDRSYALRLHRSGYRSNAEILEELDLITALCTAGLPVPRVRLTKEGHPFCHVADDDGELHQADMLEWVPDATPLGDIGAAFSGEAEIDRTTFYALGALIASLHDKAATLQRPASARPAWDADGLVGRTAVWGDPRRAFADGAPGFDAVDQAMPLLRAILVEYGKRPDRYGPIHADFTPENVLVHGSQMSVIDFDDSGDGYYLFDLATAAFFYLPHPSYGEVVSALFAGYSSVRPIQDEHRALWRPLLVARGLTYLAWAADRPGDETSDFILEHLRPLVVELAKEFTAIAIQPEQRPQPATVPLASGQSRR